MLKKLFRTKSKKVIIAYIIIALLLLGTATTVTVNVVIEMQRRYAMQQQAITFDIHDVKKNIAETTIIFYDEDGLQQVTTPDNAINCSNRTTLYVDMKLTDRTNYQFKIKDNKNNEETFDIYFEVPRAKGEYVLDHGIYVQEPYVDEGYEKGLTRYIYPDNEGNLLPGNWIDKEEPEEWYNYGQKKWANVYTEYNGREVYYVWIPRYCYKIDETQTERMDVKFINIENEHKYIDGGTEVTMTWEELQAFGYEIPHAFWWDKNDNGQEDIGEQTTGYWLMKYPMSEGETNTTVNYDVAIRKGKVKIKNIEQNNTVTSENPITKYTIALNGNIIKTIEDPDNIDYSELEFTGIREENNYINVTGLNAKGEVVGSMTKRYEYTSNTVMNEPDLTGFVPETTFYVTWDENGNEHSTIPITQEPPAKWYEYSDGDWANIVTRNNQGEIYYVWIPRYEYKVDANERTTVKFIKGTSTQTQSGYTIPDAFWWDKNNDGVRGDDEQLRGYWLMKYPMTDTTTKFNTDIVVSDSSIKTMGVTELSEGNLQEGQIFNYYIDGEYKGTKGSSTDTFTFTGLHTGKVYTILVEIRSTSEELVGTVVKQVECKPVNAPDLTGFNTSTTHYLVYNNVTDDPTIGETIDHNPPNNWYDYGENKWANIVVTDESGENGLIYYVWIPRYQYKAVDGERTDVEFIQGTSTEVKSGYSIPDAFWWDKNDNGEREEDEQLTGYWLMKYPMADV